MITQYDIPYLLDQQIPELKIKTHTSNPLLDVFFCINNFADCTKRALEQHRFSCARKCFGLAEIIYLKGDSEVRQLIEKHFVYSVAQVPQNKAEQVILKFIIPHSLYEIYIHQVSFYNDRH